MAGGLRIIKKFCGYDPKNFLCRDIKRLTHKQRRPPEESSFFKSEASLFFLSLQSFVSGDLKLFEYPLAGIRISLSRPVP